MYIAEISPAKYRGRLGIINQLAIVLGILIAYCLGLLFKNWRWLAIAGAVPSTIMVVVMTNMPESPRWLIKDAKMSEAIRVMKWLRGGSQEEIEQECRDIKSTLGKVNRTLVNRDIGLMVQFGNNPVPRPICKGLVQNVGKFKMMAHCKDDLCRRLSQKVTPIMADMGEFIDVFLRSSKSN